MERVAALLEQLDLPEISRLLRRTVYAAIVLAVAAAVALSIAGYPLAALGALIGLSLGLVNIRLVMATASKLNASGRKAIKRPMAVNTLARLALTTAVAIGLVIANLSLGMGVLGGIAVFYLLFVVNLVRALLRQGAVA
jgi:ATP synthase I chain